MKRDRTQTIVSQIDERRVAQLAQSIVKIPSPHWGEGQLADFLGAYLGGLGFDVSLPPLARRDFDTKQVVARWSEGRPGPTILLHAHMDTGSGQYAGLVFKPERWTRDPLGGEIEDGWLYGLGTQNNKNGVVVSCMAAEAVIRSGVPFHGTLMVVFVAAHGAGGVGITQLLKDGLKADAAIATEGTGQDIVTIEYGGFRGTITVFGGYAHHTDYVDAIAQAYKVVKAFSPPYQPLRAGHWLSFEPDDRLPGFPRIAIRKIESDLDTCTLYFDISSVPNMTFETIDSDLRHLLERFTAEDPSFRAEVQYDRWMEPYIENNFSGAEEEPHNSPVVRAFAQAHKEIMGEEPRIGIGDGKGGRVALGCPNHAKTWNLYDSVRGGYDCGGRVRLRI